MSETSTPPVEGEHVASHLRAVFRRRKALIALCLAGSLVPVIYLNDVTPPVYEAATTLIFEEAQGPIPFPGVLDSQGSQLVNHLEEILSLSFSADVARALPDSVIDKLTLEAKGLSKADRLALASEEIQASIGAEPVRKSNLIRIRIRMGDPELCLTIANTAAQVLQERDLRVKQEGVKGLRHFIEEQVDRFALNLKESEEELRRYKERNGITEFEGESREILQRLTEAEVLFNTAKANRAAAEQRLKSVDSTVDEQKRQLAPSVTAIATPSAQKLKEKLIALQLQYTDFVVQNYPADHPKLVSLRQEIEVTKKSLIEEAGKLARGENIVDPLTQIEKYVNESLSLQIEIESLRAQESGLDKIISGYEGELRGLPAKEFALARLMRGREMNQKIYMTLLEKLEESKISEAEQLPSLRIIDRAQLPLDPVAPRKTLNLALGLGLGLIFGTGLALAIESAKGSFDLSQNLEKLTGWPVLSWVPRFRTRYLRRSKTPAAGSTAGSTARTTEKAVRRQRPGIARPGSAAAEAYEILRTQLETAGLGSSRRTLMITSLGPGDGKSTTLANLAVAFATSGRKTLLIDAELRRPTVHSLFEIPAVPGLTDVLTRRANGKRAQESTAEKQKTFGDVLVGSWVRRPLDPQPKLPKPKLATAAPDMRGTAQTTHVEGQAVPESNLVIYVDSVAFQNGVVPNLTILASGTKIPNEKEVLSAAAMRAFLDEMVADHEVVLLDSPPLPLVHSGVMMAKLVDAVLVVVDATTYDRDMIRRVKNLLDRAGANVIGTVVNRVDLEGAYNRSYYQYYESS